MPGQNVLNVIIVEDEPIDAEILRRSLQRLEVPSLEVTLATTGKQAQVLFQKNRYDLLLLDLHLPDVVGFELIQEAKKLQQNAAIVVVTSLNSDEAALETAQLGADDYIVKDDLMGSSLGKTLRRLLRSRLQEIFAGAKKPKLIEEASDVIDIWLAWRFPLDKVPPRDPSYSVLQESKSQYQKLLKISEEKKEKELSLAMKEFEKFAYDKRIPAENLIKIHRELVSGEGPEGRERFVLFEVLAALLERYRAKEGKKEAKAEDIKRDTLLNF